MFVYEFCLWKDLCFSNSDMSTNTYNKALLDPCDSILDSIWVELGWFFSFFTGFVSQFWLQGFTKIGGYTEEVSLTLWLRTVKEENSIYIESIYYPRGLITKMGLFILFLSKKKKERLDPLKCAFVFSFILWVISLWASLWEWF